MALNWSIPGQVIRGRAGEAIGCHRTGLNPSPDGSSPFGALVKSGVSRNEVNTATQEVPGVAGRNALVRVTAQVGDLNAETSASLDAM